MPANLLKMYNHKIKTPQELKHILGPAPRLDRVVMCHGVFDVVHPGHVRHLIYAKSKGAILIASLTGDAHIDKGKYRPHVPESLRAVNLAAFEMIDYVIIDKNSTPLENISLIQPDIYAKGYEYDGHLSPKTLDEINLVEQYGGEVIFTPGDIVYSSSKIINSSLPNLQIEKLISLMDREHVSFADLRSCLGKMEGKLVHVIGDTIIDSYTQTTMIGGQTKTPTMSVLYQNRTDFVGGAGIVAEHLRSAGAKVVFSTVLGEDTLKDFTLNQLKSSDIDVRAIIDRTRPTTNKNAIVAGGYRLLKIDTLDNSSISENILRELITLIQNVPADAVVFSDFRHGIFNRRTIPKLIAAIPQGSLRVADSQVASRWGNITEFKGFDLITPNEREARFALADQDSGIRPLASNLHDAAECKTLIMKLGDRGVLTSRGRDHESLDSFFVVDSFVDRVIDAVGAGDALLAYATLSMLVTNNPVIATILGSIAAACECEKDGNYPITPADVLSKIDATEKRVNYL